MEKEGKIKKAKDTIRVFFQVLPLIQGVIAIICGWGVTIMVVVIMPGISFFGSIILGVLLIMAIAIFMVLANILTQKKREIALKKQEIAQTRKIEEQRRKDERELPKIEVLDVITPKNYFALHVRNVGAEGKVTATVVDKSEFEVRWFKKFEEIKEVGGGKEADLKRGSESYVIIRRKAVIGVGQRMSDFGLHSITLRFPETNQEFKYSFRITEERVEDLEFLGEEDE